MARRPKKIPPAQNQRKNRRDASTSSIKPNNAKNEIQNKIVSSQFAKSPIQHKDQTRKTIAQVYVFSFLVIVGLTLLFMITNCYSIIDIKDILLAESGILSGPLGFIIGFYFKEEFEKKT